MNDDLEKSILELSIENPALDLMESVQELSKRGTVVSLDDIRSVWIRNDLMTLKKRLKSLEFLSKIKCICLTKEQLLSFKKAKYTEIATLCDFYISTGVKVYLTPTLGTDESNSSSYTLTKLMK